jgi:hypothetical protein
MSREDRDQRGHAAEQRGHQVERHGAEHRLAAPDETEARKKRIPAHRWPVRRDRRARQQEARSGCAANQQRAGGIGEGGTKDVKQAADCGTEQVGQPAARDMRRDSAAEQHARRHHWHQRLHRRLLEGARNGVGQQQAIDRDETWLRKQRCDHDAGGRAELDRKANAQYEAPVVAVGNMAGDQH